MTTLLPQWLASSSEVALELVKAINADSEEKKATIEETVDANKKDSVDETIVSDKKENGVE